MSRSEFRKFRAVSTSAAAAAFLLAGGLATTADGAVVRRGDTPRFYQHQQGFQGVFPGAMPPVPWAPPTPPDAAPAPLQPGYNNGNWWENGGGWCSVTAWVNALYYWDKNGYAGLYDHTNLGGQHVAQPPPPVGPPAPWTWSHRFAYANEDLGIDAGYCALGDSVKDYISKHAGAGVGGATGYGYSNALASGFHRYRWDDTAGKVMETTDGMSRDTGYTSMFQFYYDTMINTGNSVVMKIKSGPTSPNDWLGWGANINYHVITGVGVEQNLALGRTMHVSDPDRGKNAAHWGSPYLRTDPLPIGAGLDTVLSVGADGRTIGAAGDFPGAQIDEIYTLPEPSTLSLLALGGAAALRRRR